MRGFSLAFAFCWLRAHNVIAFGLSLRKLHMSIHRTQGRKRHKKINVPREMGLGCCRFHLILLVFL